MINKFGTINPLLDYNQIREILQNQCNQGLIKQEPLCYTNAGIPIDYYTLGNGPKHIILTGSTHGCEIITTDFLLQLIDEIISNPKYHFLMDEFTFHLVPVINPEGYIVTTSAMRTLIKRDTSLDETVKLSKQYFDAYRQDDINARSGVDSSFPKLYQSMFAHTSYNDIPGEYRKLRDNLRDLLENVDIPQGSMISWSSNGNGIDPNANVYNHPRIDEINKGKVEHGVLRYNNIKITSPGPLKCPNRVGIYIEEPELRAMNKLISKVKYEGNLCGVMIYHSTWGKVFYEPYTSLEDDSDKLKFISNVKVYNKMLAEIYATKANYELMDNPGLYFVDEDIRLRVPGTLLIELSKMGGNPIGPYGDLNNYNRVMDDNMKATISTIVAYGDLKPFYDQLDNDLDKEIESRTGYQKTKL